MRPSRRSCRSSPTTRRRVRKQCRLDELKPAPLRRRQPGRHQWQRRPRQLGGIRCYQRHGFTTVLDLQRIGSRVPGLSQWQRQGQGPIRMGQEQLRREQGQQPRDVQGRWKGEHRALMVPSRGTRRATASLEGKDPCYGKCYTCGGDHCALKRKIQGTGSLGDLERAATGRTRHVFCHRYERRHPSTQVHSERGEN